MSFQGAYLQFSGPVHFALENKQKCWLPHCSSAHEYWPRRSAGMTHAATDISPSKTTDEQEFVAVSGLMPKSSCVSALAAGGAAPTPTEVTMSVRTRP